MKSELNDLLIHPKTRLSLEGFLTKPSHALLITGVPGSGKRTVSMMVASKLLDITPAALDSYPYFIHVRKQPDDKEIGVEMVRQLIKSLRLKAPGTKNIRRVVLIEDADFMSTEAQNSLLKSLEEPSVETVFILTAPAGRTLLPTIASRTQALHIDPVSLGDTKAYYSDDQDVESVDRAWQLSQGNIGLLSALLNDNETHPLKEAVETAKSLIKQSSYQRLLTLDGMTKDKPSLILLLDALNRVITSLHHSAVGNGSKSQQKRLLECRQLINRLHSDISANANPRLAVMHLALNLSV